MGEVLYLSDKDLSVAGGVGQGALRPTYRQRDTLIFGNVLTRSMPNQAFTHRPVALQSHITVTFIIMG